MAEKRGSDPLCRNFCYFRKLITTQTGEYDYEFYDSFVRRQ